MKTVVSTNRMFLGSMVLVVAVTAALVAAVLPLARAHHPAIATGVAPPIAQVRGHGPAGARVFVAKGCNACHSVDGSPRVGPSLYRDFGTTVTLDTGATVAMDEGYIRESILDPRAKARPGYPAVMPSFAGLVKPRELDALVAYIESLR